MIVVIAVRTERSPTTAVSPLSIDAVQVTVTASEATADSVSGKETVAPSSPEAFPTLSVGRALAAVTALVAALASVFANPPVSVQLAFAVSVAPRSASTTV